MTPESAAAARSPLAGRLILLAVTGSIAAYKAAELARLLVAAGAEVQPLMTASATHFLGPLTLEALTRRRVLLDPLELLPDRRIAHIVAADTADAILVAPATARWMGAMANGLADDVVTATCLASAAPVVVAPAMDGEMWSHPATQGNAIKLRDFGYRVVEPESGPLASGAVGQGRLADAVRLLSALEEVLAGRPIREPDPARRPPLDPTPRSQDLEGRRIIVTAGGTSEPIDPVRSITNRSSGKMGIAIAEAALGRGARVTLIHGVVSVPLPAGAEAIAAETAERLRVALRKALPGADALLMAAAVADFRVKQPAERKLPREGELILELEPTPDILREAVERGAGMPGRRPVFVGFAAETGSLLRARAKAARKGVDLLVANDVSEAGSGFGSDTNRVTLFAPGMPAVALPRLPKREVAERLLDRVVELLEERDARPLSAEAVS